MANMTLTFDATVGTFKSTGPTLTAEQEQRYIDWVWRNYPKLNPDGSSKSKSNANVAKAIQDHHRPIWRGIIAGVKRDEEIQSAKAVKDAVPTMPEIA